MSSDNCERCGEPHIIPAGIHAGKPSCAGHITGGTTSKDEAGRPCRNRPAPGLAKCKYHGTATKTSRAKSARIVAEQKITETARKLIPDAADLPTIVDPLQRLLELASEADGFRESLRQLANSLDRIRYQGLAGGEQLRAEVATYRAAMRDVTELLVAIARLNIDDRLARISERQIEMTMAAMVDGMSDAGLTEAQKRSVMANVGRRLRVVAS